MFDVRDAIRGLRRDAGYSATVVLTLALTIGATTAVFSIVDGVLLQPLSYTEPDRLVVIREFVHQLSRLAPSLPVNARHFYEWRDRAASFESLAQFNVATMNLTNVGDPAQVIVVPTTAGLFDALRAAPGLGRTLVDADESFEREAVAVLTDRMWRQRFNADPNVVGRVMTLDGKPHTIVGVMRPGFELAELNGLPGPSRSLRGVEAFVPLRIENLARLSQMGNFDYHAIGRLKPEVSIAQALAELNVIEASIAAPFSAQFTLEAQLFPLIDAVVGKARRGLWLLLAAIGSVLLVACSNLANLSLTRTLARLREAALRTALGATRMRLVRKVVLEQLMLACAGGAIGLGTAVAAIRLFAVTAPFDLPRAGEVAFNLRVFGFAVATTFATGLAVGMPPAWRLARRDVQQSIRSGGLATTDSRSGMRTRGMLLGMQIAASVMLLVVTGLLGLSFVRLLSLDRGFDGRQVAAVNVSVPLARYPSIVLRVGIFDRMLDRIRGVPGVVSVSLASANLMTGDSQVDMISVTGDERPPLERPIAGYRFVAADHFRTLGMSLVRGRTFSDADRNHATVPALVSEQAAARAWANRDPIGQQFRAGDSSLEEPYEVVGIVRDARTTSADHPATPIVYTPYWQRNRPTMALLVRASGDPLLLTEQLRRAIWEVDREVAIGEVTTLPRIIDAALGSRRYQVFLLSAFGAMSLLIAIVGVYAVTAYGVSRRRREMNIRMALGARATQVLGLVVLQAGIPVLLGAIAGAAGAVAVSRVLASLLFEVSARDPRVIAIAAVAVGCSGLGASLMAARRGLLLNPASALREE